MQLKVFMSAVNVNYSLYLTQAAKSDLAGLEASNKSAINGVFSSCLLLVSFSNKSINCPVLGCCQVFPPLPSPPAISVHTRREKVPPDDIQSDKSEAALMFLKTYQLILRNFICPTGCCFGKRQSSFLCHWLDNKPLSYLITVTTIYNDQKGTRVDREDAIYCYLVCMSTQWCCLLVAG